MSNETAALQFNALTDPWVPLVQESGGTVWASPVDILSGEKDGSELDYPRDDFRAYARLLLSAIVQALFPAQNIGELRERLETPLSHEGIRARLTQEVLGDFDLFGPTPFLQIRPPDEQPKGGAAPFVFLSPDLYQPPVPVECVSLPIALVTLFVEQTYAGGAGRGYGAGPGGQPGVLTLIEAGSIRRTAWANTLCQDRASKQYSPDPERPYGNVKRVPKVRTAVGLVSGLFFQPRGIWLIHAGEGRCSFTGQEGPLVRLSPFIPKSAVPPKSGVEDVWIHPCAPMAVNSQGIAPVRLHAERPAWTGLAQLLAPLSKAKTKAAHLLEGPALVIRQWKELSIRTRHPRLLILDFDRDKANVKRRFFESFPLTHDLQERETVEHIRSLANEVQEVERSLIKALIRAHDDRRTGGFALPDARTAFWNETEAPFHEWLDSIRKELGDEDAAALRRERATIAMLGTVRRVAAQLFDDHVEPTEFDLRKQELVARARRQLHRELARHAPASPVHQNPSEVSP
jgi:CRISPR type I-E-associated protein CasA/Cse1